MNELPKKTHHFVWATLITLLLVTLMWLAAELLQALAKVRRMAGWIFGLALVIGLPLATPVVGGLLWRTFGA